MTDSVYVLIRYHHCVYCTIKIIYNEEGNSWSDCFGWKETRYMFRLQPQRAVEDAYMNTHNPTITTLLGCNNNVMVRMNGRLVLYVTGYIVKSQEKEERVASEKVSENIFRNQVNLFYLLVYESVLFF